MPRYIDDSYLYRAVGADIDGACGKCIQSRSDCMCHSLSRMDICGIIEDAPTADVVDKELYDRLLKDSIIISEALDRYQSADVVEVVRCKDCRCWDVPGYCVDFMTQDENGFCAWGERRV